MTRDDLVVVFDFDGVIVDSVGALYEAYLEFLRSFGAEGSQEEFNLLNGPKLTEIVSFLKKQYQLQQTEAHLLRQFHKNLSAIYANANLNEGIGDILRVLKNKNVKVALASASRKKEIEWVLNKFKLTPYFDFIITGDDVKKANPSPEIYKRVKAHYPTSEFVVVEDSENGLQAATDAGMKTIFYNTNHKKIEKKKPPTRSLHSVKYTLLLRNST